jgi:hypothetical protein
MENSAAAANNSSLLMQTQQNFDASMVKINNDLMQLQTDCNEVQRQLSNIMVFVGMSKVQLDVENDDAIEAGGHQEQQLEEDHPVQPQQEEADDHPSMNILSGLPRKSDTSNVIP